MPITMTNDPGTLIHREAVAHNELVRMVNEYPSRIVTYSLVLAQLNLVRDLNLAMDRDEGREEEAQ